MNENWVLLALIAAETAVRLTRLHLDAAPQETRPAGQGPTGGRGVTRYLAIAWPAIAPRRPRHRPLAAMAHTRPHQGGTVKITIYGASDDCVEVKGCVGADEFYVDGNSQWQGDLVAPGGTEQLRVRAEYDPDGSGCWVISLSQTDESVPFPPWGNGTGGHESGYSTEILIDAPDGTRLTNVKPAAS